MALVGRKGSAGCEPDWDLGGEGDRDPFSLEVVSSPPVDIGSGEGTDFLLEHKDLVTVVAERREGFVNGGVAVLTQFGLAVTHI